MPRGIHKRPETATYFERHVELIPFTDCHIWVGAISNSGYGQATVKNKNMLAHRASYEIYKGKIPDGKIVLHRCDNPLCVNPDHLTTGSHSDNTIDKLNKRRGGVAKIDILDVPKIRTEYVNGKNTVKLAKEYNVSPATISNIINRKSWKHL